jgi:putative ubiquitin-RnfH superfamily antitoxin RatB of RatAB toxin-antitoxin module
MLVEVAYARPDTQLILSVDVDETATIKEAIVLSGILDHFPEIDLDKNKVGIFGKITRLDQNLREKDRVEIYRPLIADPKASRKKRAAKKDRISKETASKEKQQPAANKD